MQASGLPTSSTSAAAAAAAPATTGGAAGKGAKTAAAGAGATAAAASLLTAAGGPPIYSVPMSLLIWLDQKSDPTSSIRPIPDHGGNQNGSGPVAQRWVRADCSTAGAGPPSGVGCIARISTELARPSLRRLHRRSTSPGQLRARASEPHNAAALRTVHCHDTCVCVCVCARARVYRRACVCARARVWSC